MVYEQSDSQPTLLEDLTEALAALRVFEGSPRERIALATNLANHGFVVEDIDLLADSLKRRVKKKTDSIAGLLVTILRDPKDAAEQIQDIRKCDAAQSRRNKPEPGRSERQMGTLSYGEDSEFAQLDENQHRRIAYALVVADRKSADYAARELGCTVKQVEQWVAKETAIREKDAPPRRKKGKVVEQDNRTPEQKLADFRQFLADKKAGKA